MTRQYFIVILKKKTLIEVPLQKKIQIYKVQLTPAANWLNVQDYSEIRTDVQMRTKTWF